MTCEMGSHIGSKGPDQYDQCLTLHVKQKYRIYPKYCNSLIPYQTFINI